MKRIFNDVLGNRNRGCEFCIIFNGVAFTKEVAEEKNGFI